MLSELFLKKFGPILDNAEPTQYRERLEYANIYRQLMKEKYSHKFLSRLGRGDKVPWETKLLESEEQGAIQGERGK